MTEIEMDELRNIKWTFSSMKRFEDRSRDVLVRQKAVIPNIVLVGGRPMEVGNPVPAANAVLHTGLILHKFLKEALILEAAVAATTGVSWVSGKNGEPSQAETAIEGYLSRGGNTEALCAIIYEEFLRVSNPSSIPTWRKERGLPPLEGVESPQTSGEQPTT